MKMLHCSSLPETALLKGNQRKPHRGRHLTGMQFRQKAAIPGRLLPARSTVKSRLMTPSAPPRRPSGNRCSAAWQGEAQKRGLLRRLRAPGQTSLLLRPKAPVRRSLPQRPLILPQKTLKTQQGRSPQKTPLPSPRLLQQGKLTAESHSGRLPRFMEEITPLQRKMHRQLEPMPRILPPDQRTRLRRHSSRSTRVGSPAAGAPLCRAETLRQRALMNSRERSPALPETSTRQGDPPSRQDSE